MEFLLRPWAENSASRRVLEKAGFTLERRLKMSAWKNGVFYYSCLYARLREEQES